MRRLPQILSLLVLLALAGCGGRPRPGVISIQGPSFEPQRVPIRTLEPGPADTPSPSPSPTATPVPTPTPVPVPPPQGASITSASGTQEGNVGSFCWSDQEGGPSKCYTHEQQAPAQGLLVKKGEKTLLRIAAQIPPNDEAVRPFRVTRSGYPDKQIQPALETDLTVDLPQGDWSMDLCATWHSRGQPICWLFKLSVG